MSLLYEQSLTKNRNLNSVMVVSLTILVEGYTFNVVIRLVALFHWPCDDDSKKV